MAQVGEASSKVETRKTYCRICEPQCGLVATIEDGRLTEVRGNRDHVLSKGHLCIKASAMIDVVYDKDRLRQPMKRVGGPGEFAPVSWDEALGEIVERLASIRAKHGPASFATFIGNPTGFAGVTSMWMSGFQDALGVKWRYGINSEDTAPRFAASSFTFGSCAILTKPDLWRSQFVLILGSNPKVSHSSLYVEPHAMEALRSVRDRGGRVVVVDPRRSETAREFEHLPITTGKDAWFLIAFIRSIIEQGLVDRDYIAQNVSGYEELAAAVMRFDPEVCARECAVPLDTISQLAHDFAVADGGVVYGRIGTCTQKFGTLASILIDCAAAITGNIEREGGILFGWGPLDFEKFAESGGFATYNRTPTRVNGHPEVFGLHPSTSFPPDVLTPGEGQVRALMSVASNPVLSSGAGGAEFEEALAALDLHFSLDLYMNETNRFADFILPSTTFFERSDVPLLSLGSMLRPAIWSTEPVIPRQGEAREDWEVFQEICARMGLGGAYGSKFMRWLARCGFAIKPRHLIDFMLRMSSEGDRYGLRPGGLNLSKLDERPDGIRLRDSIPVGKVSDRVRTPDGRIHVFAPVMSSEMKRLEADLGHADPGYPIRMIGMREMKSMNSWLHNAERVMPAARAHFALVHPSDAAAYGIADGGAMSIRSASGKIEATAKVSDEISPGHIAIPHGWGHMGGWQRANDRAGVNANVVANVRPEDIEPVSATSVLNGIPVCIAPVQIGQLHEREAALS